MDVLIKNIAVSPVIHKNKFLLIKRIKPPYKNLWSLPGGKIEIGEHPQEAIIRELKEEANLDIKFIKARGVVSEILKNKNKIDGHYILWVCETRSKTEKISQMEEGEPKWFTKEEILENKKQIIPSDFEMIQAFFLNSQSSLTIHKSHMTKNAKTYLLEYFGK